MKYPIVMNQMEIAEQYFHVALFIMLLTVGLELVDEILKYKHLTLSVPRVPHGTRSHYLLNIGSIRIKFGHRTDRGEICTLKA